MDEQSLIFATIGDLEVSRRHLIMQLQEAQARIEELEAQIAGTDKQVAPIRPKEEVKAS